MNIQDLLSDCPPGLFLPAGHPDLLPEARDGKLWEGPETEALLARADLLRSEPDLDPPFPSFLRFFQDGDRQEYEGFYFARRRRLMVFGLAVLSGRGDRFLPALENVLGAVCEELTWALPAHVAGVHEAPQTVDLFAAETASALAELGCLLGARLNPALKKRMDEQIEARVLGPFLSVRAGWDWESATHNWSAVCAGGIGITALWLLDAERLVTVLKRLGPAFDAYLSGFPADGICLEGMGYWTYGFGYFVAFAELLRERSRCIDLLVHPNLREHLTAIAEFPRVGRLGSRSFVSFSDALEYRYPRGLTARLTARLHAPGSLPPELAETLESDLYARWVRRLREFVWTQDLPVRESPDSLVWYEASQWLIARQGVVGLAAKGGHNAEPHNHNDVASFQLVAGGDVLLDDLGAGRYDREYFGPGRYGYFVNSSRSHSVPLIDGREQQAGAEARADRADFSGNTLTVSLARVYDIPGLELVRSFSISPQGLSKQQVTDRFRFLGTDAHEVVERFVTRLPARVVGGSVVVQGTGASLTIRPEPAALEVRIVPVTYESHEDGPQTAHCLDFVYRVVQEAVLSFQLTIEFHTEET